LEWNRTIQDSHPSELPNPLTPEDELLILCGVYHLADGPDMIPRYVENLRVMEDTAPSFRDLQFIKVGTRFAPYPNCILTIDVG
jgi:sarcosine oxidase/L-pipecolate oxidase